MKDKNEKEDLLKIAESLKNPNLSNNKDKAPYPWCSGNPTVEDCIKAGYCRRNPNCGE